MKQEIKEIIEKINTGEVPKGYKKTEFGVFPSDWCTDKTLKGLGKFGKGKGIPGDKMIDDGIPCVGYGDIYMKYNHFHFEKALSFVDEETARESQSVGPNTLLFTGTGETVEEIGKCVCYNGKEIIYAGGDIITFIPDEVNSLFLAYQQYQSFSLRQKCAYGQGHSVVHIQIGSLEKLKVAYPLRTIEQERIAEILMKWDKAIELQESLIENISQKRTGILGSIFSKKDMLCSIKIGEFVTEKSKRNHIGNNNIKSISNKYGFINQSSQFDKLVARQNLDNYKIVEHMDVAYNPSRINVGSIAIYDDKEIAIVSPMYIVFSCNKISPALLLLALETPKGKYKIESYLTGSVRNSLSFSDLCKINIDIPKEEYRSIVIDLFAEIDRTILLEQKKLEKLKQQRKALQQYLLNGIVRVKI